MRYAMLLLQNRAGLKDVFTGFLSKTARLFGWFGIFFSITMIIETCGILLDGKVMVDV